MSTPKWFNAPYGSLTVREQQEVAEYNKYRDNTVQSDTEAYIEGLEKLHAELVETQRLKGGCHYESKNRKS